MNIDKFTIRNESDIDKLSDAYEGNLLNYFCGLTPEESKQFNKVKKQIRRSKSQWMKQKEHLQSLKQKRVY